MMHPDVQDALVEIIDGLTDGNAYHRLQPDFSVPAVLVRAEQNDNGVLATHRAQLEFYHEDLPSCKQLARVIVAHLLNAPHETSAGMLDSLRIETNIREIPYTDQLVMYTASVFVDTRPI